jgi:hypothetical protein
MSRFDSVKKPSWCSSSSQVAILDLVGLRIVSAIDQIQKICHAGKLVGKMGHYELYEIAQY